MREIKILAASLMALCLLSCGGGKSEKVSAVSSSANTSSASAETASSSSEEVQGTEQAPDFTLEGINGESISLYSLRGKYVVLDFWGSWCGWCIKGFPEMKKYYAKYSDRLEILGIDCNDSKSDWISAVEENELPWRHVRCPEGSEVLEQFNVTGFPTKIIIDKQGRVIEGFEGEDPQFYEFLDEMFK